NGWLSAGPYYRTISGYAERNQKIMKSYPRYLSPNIRKIQVTTNKQFDALCKRLEAVEKADDIETHIASASDGKEKGSVTKIVNKLFYASFGKWGMNTITNCLVKGDPIGNLTSLGHKMISASTLMFVTGVTARAAATAAVGAAKKTWWGRLANMVSGVGDILEDVTNGFFEGIWPLFMVVLMALYSQGVLLAYYLPMVPFMFWWLAVVGWFILVIEALFAAPIWAAAHAIPDGRGLINAHAKPGYKLLLGVLLRPPLMVSGFLVAMVLITKIGNILGEAFKLSFGTGVAANHMVGPVGVLILTILLSMFLIAICQKIFGLVTHLPDSVIKWVGGVGRNLGESGDLHRIQDSFSGAMDKGEQGTGDLNRGPQKSKTKGKKGFKSKKKT
ncbi:MAG: DotA/TraY family protein, partial [Desulfobacteraceae bacterium]|nr:DotA/TraY family protein [Desulfobacteraceae bacterium]